MNPDSSPFCKAVRAYFERLQILATQIPFDLRRVLLPSYMLYNGFKSSIHIDEKGKLGFEVYRERASRISMKTKVTKGRVEEDIFGFFGNKNAFLLGGGAVLQNMVFTSEAFSKRHETQLPKYASVIRLSSNLDGLLELRASSQLRAINCSVYFLVKGKRYVKHIPFAWLLGNSKLLATFDPVIVAESDFYSSLFGAFGEIVSHGYEQANPATQRKSLELYIQLLRKVEEEFKKQIQSTEDDEQVLQQLTFRYKFFLSPEAMLIESQPTLKGEVSRKPDFHIQLRENEHVYVEIEPSFCKPFEDSKMSRRLEGALNQVKQWKKLLVEGGQKEGIHYMVIIGFLNDLNTAERETLKNFKAEDDIEIQTWDWILSSIERTMQNALGELKKQALGK